MRHSLKIVFGLILICCVVGFSFIQKHSVPHRINLMSREDISAYKPAIATVHKTNLHDIHSTKKKVIIHFWDEDSIKYIAEIPHINRVNKSNIKIYYNPLKPREKIVTDEEYNYIIAD